MRVDWMPVTEGLPDGSDDVNETILHKFPPIRWEPAACPNCGAHIEGLRYRGREAEIDWQGLEHRELSAGFKEWKYEE